MASASCPSPRARTRMCVEPKHPEPKHPVGLPEGSPAQTPSAAMRRAPGAEAPVTTVRAHPSVWAARRSHEQGIPGRSTTPVGVPRRGSGRGVQGRWPIPRRPSQGDRHPRHRVPPPALQVCAPIEFFLQGVIHLTDYRPLQAKKNRFLCMYVCMYACVSVYTPAAEAAAEIDNID